MNCPNCGCTLNNDAAFCGFCGYRMGDPLKSGGARPVQPDMPAGGYTPPTGGYTPPTAGYSAPAGSYTPAAPAYPPAVPYTAPDLTPAAPAPAGNTGKAIAAMALGLSSLVFDTLCILIYISYIFAPLGLGCGIAGMILGAKAIVPGVNKMNGIAKTGKITGLIGMIIAAVMLSVVIILLVSCAGVLGCASPSYYY